MLSNPPSTNPPTHPSIPHPSTGRAKRQASKHAQPNASPGPGARPRGGRGQQQHPRREGTSAGAGAGALPSVQAETLEELSGLIRAGLVQAKDTVALDALTQGGGRRSLVAGRQDCDVFLTLTLAPLTTECSELANDLQTLGTTSEQCQRVYDFSKPKLDGICTNKCYAAMVEALDKMSKAGCSVDSVTTTMCDQCPDGTVCAKGVCREACSAKKPCRCDGQCVDGGCKPSDQIGVQRAEMGTYGYKVSLEHLCLAPPSDELPAAVDPAGEAAAAKAAPPAKEYCMTSMFGAINAGLDMGACDRVAATGCCAGTVFQYGRQCALADDTINTQLGPIKMGHIEALCANVDFKTKCPNAPAYEEGNCKPEFLEGGGEAALPFPGAW